MAPSRLRALFALLIVLVVGFGGAYLADTLHPHHDSGLPLPPAVSQSDWQNMAYAQSIYPPGTLHYQWNAHAHHYDVIAAYSADNDTTPHVG